MTRFALPLLVIGLSPLFAADPPPAAASITDPNPASLDVPADADHKARGLVRQLGDREYATREEAHRDLRDLGRLALPALQDAYENSDEPEVVERCEQLIPRAKALDTRARVDCFAADPDGQYDHKLPGAKEFFAVTGRTEPARKLFRDLLLSANRDLIAAVGDPDDEVARKAVARRVELYPRAVVVVVGGQVQKPTTPTALDVIALLFVEATIPEKALTTASGIGGVAVVSPTQLITASNLRASLETDPRKEAMSAVTVRWFETREEIRTISACMTTAANLKLPVTTPLAKKVLGHKAATPLQKAQAVCNIAKVGDEKDVPTLAPLLKDETPASPGVVVIVNGQQQRSPIQMRDVALAMSLLMTKQDPTEYGFKARYASNSASETLKFNYHNYHFDDADGTADEKRTEAFKKWDTWAAKNLKAEKKK